MVMEPKVIKEETLEKEVSGYGDTQTSMRTRTKTVASLTTTPPKDRCKTPDSPEGARLSQSGGPVSPGAAGSGGGTGSPRSTGSPAGSVSPPPLPLPPPAQAAHLAQLHPSPAAAAAYRPPLAKVKRFLTTLVQFGHDIGPDVGDRVRSLVLSLVSASVSVEEFQQTLQEVTNFPVRAFVLPFLRAHLPPLQREVHALARAAKQTPLQYLRSHEHVVLEAAHSPAEPSEIFLSTSAETPPATAAAAVKRRASDALYENGINGLHSTPLAHEAADFSASGLAANPKRPFTAHSYMHQGLLLPNLAAAATTGPAPPPAAHHLFEYQGHPAAYTTTATPTHRGSLLDDIGDGSSVRSQSRGDEEWRNIHVMLNCILSMVEKTKRALSILQQRNSQDVTHEWLRRQDVSGDLKKAAAEIMAQAVRQTEDRVADVRRKAEEAVNDVKRQAVVELQKAVSNAEIRANELVASERAKMEKMLMEARKHSEEPVVSNHVDGGSNGGESSQSPPVSAPTPAPSQQNSCWNCGRKAHETCSGCSVARYCGPFCQHKDWENHHQVCCSRDKPRPQRATTPGAGASPAPAATTPAASQDTVRLKK